MIQRDRHVPLRTSAWDEHVLASAIDEIVSDALAHFQPEGFWPSHPLDGVRDDGHSSLYMGAAGMIWGLDYLQRVGATKASMDFRPVLPRLLEKTQAEMAGYGDYGTLGSLLFGDLGTALVVMRLAPESAIADLIHARCEIDTHLPVRELMWGMPGAMLACVHMAEMTDEQRWASLFKVQAARLLADLEETTNGPLWTQDLYGQAAALPRSGSRLRRQHDPADPRLAMVGRRAAAADFRSRRTCVDHQRLALGRRRHLATGRRPRELAPPSWRSRHGGDVRRCSLRLSSTGGAVGRRRQLHLGRPARW